MKLEENKRTMIGIFVLNTLTDSSNLKEYIIKLKHNNEELNNIKSTGKIAPNTRKQIEEALVIP